MDVTFSFVDGDSELSIRITENGVQIRRPSTGMTPMLEAIAADFLDEEFTGDAAETEKAKNFVQQAEKISVVIGEERCG